MTCQHFMSNHPWNAYLVPMFLDTTFSPVWECLSQSRLFWSETGRRTLAISLHDLLLSRICLSLCSSEAVQGVFVRVFFLLLLSSESNDGIDIVEIPPDSLSIGAFGTGGGLRFNGRDSVTGLRDACLFRELDAGGGAVSSVVLGYVGGGNGLGKSAAEADGEDDAASTLGRFEFDELIDVSTSQHLTHVDSGKW